MNVGRAHTAARLQERLRTAASAVNTETLLQQLAAALEQKAGSAPLRWIRASIGQTITLIPVQDVDFLRSEEKYTVVAWHEADGALREAIIRTALKELVVQLDAAQFAQVHRPVVVNLNSIARLVRGSNETPRPPVSQDSRARPAQRPGRHIDRRR